MPEPHILLTVVAGTSSRRPAAKPAWRAGAWPWPGGEDAAHQQLADLAGLHARALQRRLDRGAAQLGRRGARKLALEAAHGRARGADDDDGIVVNGHERLP